jgi:hypothetical protein
MGPPQKGGQKGGHAMVKAFSLVSWNVEHFKNVNSRVENVAAFLTAQDPDVFALYEVEGSEVFETLSHDMPGFTCHITEGPQAQEILVGVKANITAFFTQKVEFKGGDSLLRPGALLTVTIDGAHYPILFLHTKSGNDPKGLGLRDDMLVRACDFRKVLNKADPHGTANYIFLGDLNTMGMEYAYVRERDISVAAELTKLERKADASKMRLLTKTHSYTWSNGSGSAVPDSNLDHVIAAKHLQFKAFDGAQVAVRGWAQAATPAAKDEWINKYSDHCLLYLEAQRV